MKANKCGFTRDNICVIILDNSRVLIGNRETEIVYEVKSVKKVNPIIRNKDYKKVKVKK